MAFFPPLHHNPEEGQPKLHSNSCDYPYKFDMPSDYLIDGFILSSVVPNVEKCRRIEKL